MVIKEFGKNNKDVIILLHGGGLSWWNYMEVSKLLQNEYHVIVPILDGHSGSDSDFVSIEKNADEIIEFINDNYGGHVRLIGGLSLGGQILLEILSKSNGICDYALIESALVIPMRLTHKLIGPSIKMSYGLISKRWFSKLQFRSLKINNNLFDYYYEDTKSISVDNMISFLKANSDYNYKEGLLSNKCSVLVVVGRKERRIMIKSAELINALLPNSTLKVLDGYYHGDLSINHADQYVEMIKDFIR